MQLGFSRKDLLILFRLTTGDVVLKTVRDLNKSMRVTVACGGAWAAHGAGARCAAWWARTMAPGVRPVGGVLGVRPDGGWSTAAPRGSAGRVV